VNLYNGTCEVEFTPTEVGAYVVDAAVGNMKVYGCPMIEKAYDTSLIRVSEVTIIIIIIMEVLRTLKSVFCIG
jgi:hypothetical protein